MREWTTIRVRRETAEALKRLGKKGQSYDDVIRALIEEHERSEKERMERYTFVPEGYGPVGE